MRSTCNFQTPKLSKLFIFAVAVVAMVSTHCVGQTVMLSFGTLNIDGTMENDRAVVRNAARGMVVVRMNGQTFRFNSADIDRIRFFGGYGDDDFINNTGIEAYAYGGPGADYLVASTGRAEFYGDSGDDTLVGGTQRDFLYGNGNDDLIFGNGEGDVIFGDGRFREQLPVREIDLREVSFAAFNEEEEFEEGDDMIFSGGGDDRVYGNGGDDRIFAGAGNDFVSANDGNDRVFGSSGNDCLEGGDGDDLLNGGSGGDTLAGGFDNDRLFGMSGNDTLFGGNGTDQLNGGSGNDVEVQNGPNFCEGGDEDEDEEDDVPSAP